MMKNLKLKTKLILSVIVVSFIPLILLVFFSNHHVANFTEKKYVTSTRAMLYQMEQRIDDHFKVLDQNSIRFFSDMFYESDVQNISPESQEFYRITLYNLFNFFSNREETHSVVFYSSEEDEVYVVNDRINYSFRNDDEMMQMDWYKRLLESPKRRTIEPLRQIEEYPAKYHIDQGEYVISFNRIMYDRSKVYGILSANYRPDFLVKLLREIVSDQDETIFYIDGDGSLLASTLDVSDTSEKTEIGIYEKIKEQDQSSGFFHYFSEDSNSNLLIVYTTSDKWNNMLYKVVPVQTILKEVAETRNAMLLVSAVLIVLLIITSTIISIKITRPLLELKRQMQKLEKGDFESEIKVQSNDEIGVISTIFNQMTHRINEMINEQYKNELILKTAQLKTLQAQINPHFLNNTLLAIGSVAMSKGVDEIESMSRALSSMLRYSISAQENNVPLRDEIDNVAQYLAIQQFRFEERLEYELDTEERCLDFLVPKLILQPLVENAIIHGIEKSIEPGIVKVRVYAEDEQLVIEIENSFRGMLEEKLLEIRRKMSQANSHDVLHLQHHGILNVYHRLKWLFGNEFEMKINSSPETGTVISLHLPFKGER